MQQTMKGGTLTQMVEALSVPVKAIMYSPTLYVVNNPFLHYYKHLFAPCDILLNSNNTNTWKLCTKLYRKMLYLVQSPGNQNTVG